MNAPLVLSHPAAEAPKSRKAYKAPASKPHKVKAEPTAKKVWTGARKKIAVSQLQMSLPGMGQPI